MLFEKMLNGLLNIVYTCGSLILKWVFFMDAELSGDIDAFQEAVGKLSNSLSRSGLAWSDNQFQSLYASIGHIASASKSVVISGQECLSSISRFRDIAQWQEE